MKKRIREFLFLISTVSFILTACSTRARIEDTAGSADTVSSGQESTGTAAAATMQQVVDEGKLSQGTEYILPEVSTRLYSQGELEILSADQMKLARNEIYARHGRKFKDQSLQEYFQGKSWYQGTVEPDQFGDGQLNQTERSNLELLKRLENEARNGRTGYPTAPYAKAFAKWDDQHKGQKISEDLYRDGMGSVNSTDRSKLIQHDKYYEITDCEVEAQGVYDRSVFDGRAVGDVVNLSRTKYLIRLIKTGTDGFREIGLAAASLVNPEESSEGMTYVKECREGFYTEGDNDVKGPCIPIYEGSVYFYRDARIVTGMGKGEKTMTAEEYFETQAPDSNAAQQTDPDDFIRGGGLMPDGGISLLGIPSYDRNYYFTGFREGSRYWVG